MTQENILVLAILLIAVVLFVSEKLRVDLIAMMVLITLVVTGLVSVDEAFSGFSSPAVITVWSVYIVSGALFRSGVADSIAQYMLRVAGESYLRILLVIMVTIGLMSAVMNNIGAVAILLPAVMSISRSINVSPSKLLIPMAFVSLLGGNTTLIGTPPNILATQIMVEYGGLEPFSFFSFTPMGLIVLATGISYFMVFGRRLLPDRKPGAALSDTYEVGDYLSEVRVADDSDLAGKTLREVQLGSRYDLNVVQIQRGGGQLLSPAADRRLQAGDILLVQGSPQQIFTTSEAVGLEALTEYKFEEEQEDQDGYETVEITLAPNTTLNGLTLKQSNFRNRYGLTVLAIQQQGEARTSNLADIPLSFGDALLVRGPTDRIALLRSDEQFLVLETPPIEARRLKKAPIAVVLLAAVVLVVALQIAHVSVAMLTAAMLMVLFRVLTMDEAYKSIEWKSVFLIAGMLPMGIAMQSTGTAAFIANQIVDLVGGFGPMAVVMGIFLLTALLTEVMSNAAATVLIVPIAIDAARSLEVNPQTLIMAVILAAATSFLMPIGHQANVLIFGPGGYKFFDYTKVGVWLNILIFIVVAITLPIVWPLNP